MSDSVVSHWVSLNQAIIIKGQKEGAAPETTPLQNSTHTSHGPNCWQILSTFSSRFLYFKLPPQLLSLYPSSFLRAFLEKPRLQCINITAAATGPAPCRRRHRIPHRARPVTVSLTNRTISFFAGQQRKNFARWSSRAQVAGSLPHCPSFASSSGYSDGGDAGPEDLCLPKHCYKTFPTFIVKGSCH